jgi:hypothetical protein
MLAMWLGSEPMCKYVVEMGMAYCWGSGAAIDDDVDFLVVLFYLYQLHNIVLDKKMVSLRVTYASRLGATYFTLSVNNNRDCAIGGSPVDAVLSLVIRENLTQFHDRR